MNKQAKRDTVIKGLECRLDINGSKYKHCLTCDYRHDIDHCQWACQTDGILEDALALLKAQEPRVKALEEVRALQDNAVVWVEDYDKVGVIPAIVNHVWNTLPNMVSITVAHMREVKADMLWYGIKWRCWTSCPSDEQRRETPWDA